MNFQKIAVTGLLGLLALSTGFGCADTDRPTNYGRQRPPIDQLDSRDRGLQSADVLQASERIAASLLSLPASLFIDRTGARKKVFLWGLYVQRLLWFPIALAPVLIVQRFGIAAAVLEVEQHPQALPDNVVRLPSQEVDDKPQATGVVLVLRVIQALFLWKAQRCHVRLNP